MNGIIKRTLAALTAVAALGLAPAAPAANVTWSGGDMTWSQPDTDSFSATYNSGDTVNFTATGAGAVTIASGGVTPGLINLKANDYVFSIAEDNALGTADISEDNYTSATFSNTKGSEVLLANTFAVRFNPKFTFSGGDFRLTGTVNGSSYWTDFSVNSGVTVTFPNGIASYTIFKSGAGTLKILTASAGRVAGGQGFFEFYHDAALGSGTSFDTVAYQTSTFVPGGGTRTLSQNFNNPYGAVAGGGTHDLILNGTISGGYGSLYMNGTGALWVNGNNSFGNYVDINSGTLVAGHNNALGGMTDSGRKKRINTGGRLSMKAGVTLAPHATYGDAMYDWKTGSSLGGSGTFQRNAAWAPPASFTFAPGLPGAPGTLTVSIADGGNVTLGDGRTLEIDMSGTGVDRLTVAGGGNLVLSGTTDKLVLRGSPKPGSHVIADAAAVSGVFNVVDTDGLTVSGGKVVYEPDRIRFVLPPAGTVVAVR